jgi:hypothetical protein
MKLASETYRLTVNFPKHELCGLSHARGSLLELETQVEIARDLGYLSVDSREVLLRDTKVVGKGLTGLINHLTSSEQSSYADDRGPRTEDRRRMASD